jgi:ribosomal-protein-alanine N-acetyltransferase
LETDRLILRDWKDEDVESYSQMNLDPDVMRFFPSTVPAERSKQYLVKTRQSFYDLGYGQWAVELRETGQFIGLIGFARADFKAGFTPCIEIAWRLHKDFWNRGYATEGAQACLDYGFQVLNLDVVHSFTAILNVPSQRVMEKIGLGFVGRFKHPALPKKHPLKPHVRYKLKKRQYLSRNI